MLTLPQARKFVISKIKGQGLKISHFTTWEINRVAKLLIKELAKPKRKPAKAKHK